MHLHILGICGTFMGGLALIARAAGHRVTGCDAGVYPPMSTQLIEQGIDLIEGFGADQIALRPDLFVVGNVVTRGNPLMEAILDAGLPYTSGPQWLGDHVLAGRHVLAVAGTHGKTTTTAMLAWILDQAGLAPSFLVGGVPQDFGMSARLGTTPAPGAAGRNVFAIEADEYDTAFFDKRSKFVHYRARTVVLNNLEYDHADIFPDLAAIETQFHHLVRTVPASGRIIAPTQTPAIDRVLARGCWSDRVTFGAEGDWQAGAEQDDGAFEVALRGSAVGTVRWALSGAHNRMNALAAIAAADHVGVPPAQATAALSRFAGVKRRMELRGTVADIRVYDDFAHHPTAIETTVAGLRRRMPAGRILAVLEPRSNTMKLGAMKAQLPASLHQADRVFCYGATDGKQALGWSAADALSPLGNKAEVFSDLPALVAAVTANAAPGDHVLVMSNGGFGGVHDKLLTALSARFDGGSVQGASGVAEPGGAAASSTRGARP
jgi:UDP-N-acetylmuramate: L-alanyl-gamma-D-glutamyl-meso-diaminopimelate ligase